MNFKKYIVAAGVLSQAELLLGQAVTAAAPTPGTTELASIMTWILVGATAFMVVVGILFMLWVNKTMYNRILKLEQMRTGIAIPEQEFQPEGEDFWTRMRKKYWENAVPIDQEEQIISDHAFDGIRELDNKLPPWWVNMFILTIIWAFGYMYYYHWGGNGPNQKQEYEMEVETAKKEIAMALANQANKVDEANVAVLTDAADLGSGELIFNANCLACHGKGLEGSVGPNLTDEYWIHGGGIKNVFKVIKYGVPEKGMISWQATLRPADMQKVASYILSKQGSNPANPKAPQGVIWVDEAAAPKDTTAAQ